MDRAKKVVQQLTGNDGDFPENTIDFVLDSMRELFAKSKLLMKLNDEHKSVSDIVRLERLVEDWENSLTKTV